MTRDTHFHQTEEQIGRMRRALDALRREILPVNPRQFSLLAEGPLEEIEQLEQALAERSPLAPRED